jgi:hypothetical protein
MIRIGSSSAACSRKPLAVSMARAVEIIGAESKMAIVVVDFASPEGAGRIEDQMHLQGAAGEPGAGALEGRPPLHHHEAEQVVIERRATAGDR